MDNLNQILKKLSKRGFRLERGNGSKGKLFSPNPTHKFYSIHISGGEKTTFPLKRFARKEWNLDLESL